jgi:hypothetical protein
MHSADQAHFVELHGTISTVSTCVILLVQPGLLWVVAPCVVVVNSKLVMRATKHVQRLDVDSTATRKGTSERGEATSEIREHTRSEIRSDAATATTV